MKHIVITGGCGFIGHHLVDRILNTTDWKISILDALSYASRGIDRLRDIRAFKDGRVQVFPVNLAQSLHADIKKDLGQIDYIAHLAAEVHVDRSIADPEKFIQSNIMGTFQMLQFARECQPERFYYFGTDEEMGPNLDNTLRLEWDRYNSGNPYAATKASAEELTLAWANTYKVPVIISHCTNVFGERQNPEAFIPNTIRKILNVEKVVIHTNADGISGSRFYIHARDVASAILFLLDQGTDRDKFNITGREEISNLDLACEIACILNKPLDYETASTIRPGCDFRYGLDGSKMRDLGWLPIFDFHKSLKQTAEWYKANPNWLKKRSTAVFE